MPSPDSPERPPTPAIPKDDATVRYWRANLLLMLVLLTIWFVVSLGCGVLWANALNGVRLGGFPLGFWFAQQGSIITFVLLILVYCVVMNRLDRKHHEELARRGRSLGSDRDLGEGV